MLDLCVGGIVPDYAQPPSRTAWTSRAEWLPGLNPPATNTLVSSTTSPGPVVITVVWTPGDSLCKTPGDRHGRSRASLCPCCPTNSLRVCQPDEFRAGCNVSQPYAIDDDAPVPDRPAWSARPASIKNSRVYSRTAAVRAFHWYPRSFRKPDHGRSTARYVSPMQCMRQHHWPYGGQGWIARPTEPSRPHHGWEGSLVLASFYDRRPRSIAAPRDCFAGRSCKIPPQTPWWINSPSGRGRLRKLDAPH